MKNNKINYAFILLLIVAGLMSSCVKDDDFNTPDTSINPPEIDGDTISIPEVKAMYMQDAGVSNLEAFNGNEQLTFQGTKLFMTGYIVSSDEAGNFHEELIIQDKAENPTAGVKLMIKESPLFTRFEVGRKVYVELDGFTVGFSNGVIAIGIPKAGSDFVDKAPSAFTSKIMRTPEKKELIPHALKISEFERKFDNTLIKLEGAEFPENIVLGDNAKTYAAEPGEEYDAERPVQVCEGNATTALMTSTFADFKALKLPKGSGDIHAILTKTFNGSAYRLKINDPTYMDFGPERCDGEEPGDGDDDDDEPGDGGDMLVVDVPFYEDFEGLVDYDAIAIEGWTNQDVVGSTRLWEARSFDGNGYAQLTAFNAGGAVETWLVTPGLDLTEENAAELSFETKDGHYNGEALSVFVSSDFNGDADDATWSEITGLTISEGHASGYGDSFVYSGEADLSEYAGQVIFVGFKYEGSDGGISTTIQVDNVSVTADGSGGGGDGGDGGDNPNPPSSDATHAFAGADFENWQDFLDGLNQFGIKNYATQSNGTGVDGSASMHISTDPSTTDGNDYVFTATAIDDLPTDYSKISFYMKGSSTKSVSFNVYKTDGSYEAYNLEDLSADATITVAENNQYNGTINTGGDWVLVSLDLSSLNDVNVSDTSGDILALKIGKNADYDLHFDNFTIE